MKQFISCLLFFFSTPAFLYSQFVPTYKWGKVLPEEIQLKVCAIDSSASAVVLSDYGKVIFGNGVIYIERHKRIKILDQKGSGEGNITIPYYTKDHYEKITGLQAHTITIDQNGKIATHKVNADQIFEVDLANKWREKRFTFPNVEAGAILEYRYTTLTHNYLTLDGWNFQSGIPTIYSEFHFVKPTRLNYRILLQGEHLSTKYENASTTTWSLNNLPALIKESFIANPMDYAERISFQLDVFNISGSVPVSFENHSSFFS
ncbi:DUF3857 domain-containing protein [Rhodocytophaga rosea]|uniref:DUF3857 domain-containing protein n=1 Tax=Rhodocytophaga rosea TaxID=2704465 RepID=A0A6C0GKP4_9BACT|nr:DUF3857 domain-containing protein [Rhodocytophaga rosea]QHT68384.1 DUF3857 domain-containing protein [Rhodocytophaga rosea]